jgi:predicted DNA-binding transcriptional regulator YafY
MAGRRRKPKEARTTKVSVERFARILQMIRHKGHATMQQFQDELEISRASVKRDIDFLRDRLECPLRYDTAIRAWVLEDDGKFELPGMWFEASEVCTGYRHGSIQMALPAVP